MAKISDLFNKIPKPWVEATKEFFRVILLFVSSFILMGGFDLYLQAYGTGLTPEQILFWSTALTFFAKSIDKGIHEKGKEVEKETGKKSKLTKGITRF